MEVALAQIMQIDAREILSRSSALLVEPDFGLKQGLRRWEERMGTHLQPVLRRSGRRNL